jgi:hypothetical protein
MEFIYISEGCVIKCNILPQSITLNIFVILGTVLVLHIFEFGNEELSGNFNLEELFLLYAGFLLGLFFDSKNRSKIFLRNVG